MRTRLYKKGRGYAVLAGILAGTVLFTGCGSGSSTAGIPQEGEALDTAMGRYLEEELSLPEGFDYLNGMKLLKDGTIRIIGVSGESENLLADSQDGGKSWTNQEISSEKLFHDAEGISCAGISSEGALFLQTLDYSKMQEAEQRGEEITMESYEDLVQTRWYYGDGKGTLQELSISEQDTAEMGQLMKCSYEGDGFVYFTANGGGLWKMNPETGEILFHIEEGNLLTNFGIVGERLILVGSDGVLFYDKETGKPSESDQILVDELADQQENLQLHSMSASPIYFQDGGEDSLFYLTSSGVMHHAWGGSVTEKVIDGNLNSLGSPDTGFLDFQLGEDGSFYVAAMKGDGTSTIYHYVYSKDTPAVPDTELTVFSLADSSPLRQAITRYQKEHPDVYVNLQVGTTGEEGMTVNDALKNLNTEIMAGKGPDLLLLDGMNAESYEEKGLLMDLGEIVSQVEEQEGLLENIVNAYRNQDGSIYEIPLQFGIPIVEGEKEIIDGIEDLPSLKEAMQLLRQRNPEAENIAFGGGTSSMLSQMLSGSSSAWTQEDGSLNEEALTEFFREFKEIYDVDSLEHSEQEYSYMFAGTVGQWGLSYDSIGLLAKQKYLNVTALSSPMDVACLYASMEKLSGDDFRSLKGQTENTFLPYNRMGISSKSQEQEEAGEFLKFLLSSDIQTQLKDSGFAVNETAYDNTEYWGVGTGEFDGYTIGAGDVEAGSYVELNLKDITKDQAKRIQELGKQLTTPVNLDTILLEAVQEQLEKYVQGTVTLEEGIQALMQQMNLYLAE